MQNANIGFGCSGLSSMPTQQSALSLLQTAYNNGIRHFDTAPIYGSGYSEKILGKFLKGKREQVTISTKFGLMPSTARNIPIWLALPLNKIKGKLTASHSAKDNTYTPERLSYRRIDYNEIRTSFENSLKNLQTDHIDFYLLHEALPNFLTDEAMNYVQNLKSSGFVKKIGIAACYINLYQLEPYKVSAWDILQYENGLKFSSDDLLDRFPGKIHIYHSVLKNVKNITLQGNSAVEVAGALLAKSFKNNPDGLILFSTTNKARIGQNLDSMSKYIQMPLKEVNTFLSDAIH